MKLNDEISKKNPFRVPGGYFESLADRTMAAISEEAKSGGEAGTRPSLKAGGFTAEEPGRHHDGSFTGQDQADSRVEAGNARTTRIVSLRPFLALAAAILGFAILATVMVRLINADRNTGGYEAGTSLYADLAFEEVDTYFLERELSSVEQDVPEITGDEISTDAIIDYLMTEDIDLNDIYELL